MSLSKADVKRKATFTSYIKLVAATASSSLFVRTDAKLQWCPTLVEHDGSAKYFDHGGANFG